MMKKILAEWRQLRDCCLVDLCNIPLQIWWSYLWLTIEANFYVDVNANFGPQQASDCIWLNSVSSCAGQAPSLTHLSISQFKVNLWDLQLYIFFGRKKYQPKERKAMKRKNKHFAIGSQAWMMTSIQIIQALLREGRSELKTLKHLVQD